MKRFLLFVFMSTFYFGFLNAQNILKNGDFESWDDDNTPTSWTHVENITKETTIVHGGSFSAKHVGGTKDLSQTVSVVPGKKYKFTVWYYVAEGDGTDARLWCVLKDADGNPDFDNTPGEIRGPDNGYLNSSTLNEWLKYETIITIPDGLPQLYYELRTYSGATVYWDDLSVEAYSSSAAIDLTAPNEGNYQNGDIVHITWNSSGVDSVLMYARMEGFSKWFLITEDSALPASASAFDLSIPDDAEEGNYKFIIVDKDDPTVADSSDNFIFVKDVVFAGLDDDYPFSPPSGSTGVPTDLFKERLEMHFQESVQPGPAGKIYIKKTSNDMLVKEFDVTDPKQVSTAPDEPTNIYIYLPDGFNLDPNTEYYVTVDAGAIEDMAGTPNSCPGISDKNTWAFTTGEGGSYTTIDAIQHTNNASGESDLLGLKVKTRGIVMAVSGSGYFIQEAAKEWSGIYVYDPDNSSISVGDELAVAGTVDEFHGLTQLKDVMFKMVKGSGNVFDAVDVTLADLGEPYESVLVKVKTVTCSNPDLGYGEWEISDGTNTGRVDDLFDYTYVPAQDDEFVSIAGILNYSYSNFKLEPRLDDDIVQKATAIKKVDNSGLSIGPNPVINDMRISADKSIARVQVLNSVGQIINDKKVSVGQVVLSTAGLAKGLYVVKITFVDGTIKLQKIIKR